MPETCSLFQRAFPVHDLPLSGHPFSIAARPDEREALAREFGIIAIDHLAAEGVLRPEGAGRRIKLEGRLSAAVVQTCVVSLDPVPARIDVPFERLYASDIEEEGDERPMAGEVFLDLADDLPIDYLSGEVIDVGAAAAEQLALELDPYPRKPGALFTGCDQCGEDGDGAQKTAGPLAKLAGWGKARRSDDMP